MRTTGTAMLMEAITEPLAPGTGIFSANTGLPNDITDSKSAIPESRPDVAAGVSPVFNNYQATLHYLNPAAFLQAPILKASGAATRPRRKPRSTE
jgi:hypothetical protein